MKQILPSIHQIHSVYRWFKLMLIAQAQFIFKI